MALSDKQVMDSLVRIDGVMLVMLHHTVYVQGTQALSMPPNFQ